MSTNRGRSNELDPPTDLPRPVISCAIDDVAMAALRERKIERVMCGLCGHEVTGPAASSGLMMWARGDEVRFDEPPLCGPCARSIGVVAFARWRYGNEIQ